MDLNAYVAKVKPLMTEKHAQERVDWARTNLSTPDSYWSKVMFTDEALIRACDP